MTAAASASGVGDLQLDDEFRTDPIFFQQEEAAPSGGRMKDVLSAPGDHLQQSVQPYVVSCTSCSMYIVYVPAFGRLNCCLCLLL